MGPVCADGSTVTPMTGVKEVAYRVKNTFVEIGPKLDEEVAYLRCRRCKSDATDKLQVASPPLGPVRSPGSHGSSQETKDLQETSETSFVPDTPSPMLRPAPELGDVPPLEGAYGMCDEDMCLPPAWSDEAIYNGGMGYDGDMSAYYGVPMIYNPMSGWSMCMPLEAMQGVSAEEMAQCEMVGMDGVMMDADGTTGDVENGMWVEVDPNEMAAMCCNMEANGSMMDSMWGMDSQQMAETEPVSEWKPEVATETPKKEEPEKKKQEWSDMQDAQTNRWEESRSGNRHNNRKWRDEGQSWDDRKEDDRAWDSWDYSWKGKGRNTRRSQRQGHDTWSDREWRSWYAREEESPAVQEETPQREEQPVEGSTIASSSSESLGNPTGGDSGYTTVMLRNIPNKYTREMLVKQLNQDFKGCFDFVYLPIDFKNKCNVGYGFVNFRTSASCDEFISRYDGVDVRKCLPGLNSKKIAGVTPARVQGLEENVRRLRTGPVMNELVNHPDWMPLLLDDNGEAVPFPMPDHPAPAPKLKRRAREEHTGSRGW